jgi:hypothetical protein
MKSEQALWYRTGVRLIRGLICLAVLISTARAEWSYFRSGPVEVWTDADGKTARSTLASLDQLRYWTARVLGRDEINPLWPVRILVLKKGGAPNTPGITLKRDAYTAVLRDKEEVPAAWMAEYAAILLRDDARPMPSHIEAGIVRLLSTLEANGSRTIIGKPVAKPDRDFARAHLFIVNPEYSGRSRVFFGNLQQGAPFDTAYRNAFEKTEKEMEAEVDRYLAAGSFEPQHTSGKPLNPERDYRERPGEEKRARILLADVSGDAAAYRAILNGDGADPDAFEGAGMFLEATQKGSESARAWYRYAISEKEPSKAQPALRKAMELNPRWAEPHAYWASLETDAGRKVPPLQKACELAPRNLEYWAALAQAQTDARDFDGAARSWRSALFAAPDETTRARIAARREAYEKQRFDLEAAERRRQEEERARELDQLKQEALAKIRKAEEQANAGNAPGAPGGKPVEWWDGPKAEVTVTGTLQRIECGRVARWHVTAEAGKPQVFTVADPGKIAIIGSQQVTLGCGPQRPPRKVRVEAAKTNEVLTVEFLP